MLLRASLLLGLLKVLVFEISLWKILHNILIRTLTQGLYFAKQDSIGLLDCLRPALDVGSVHIVVGNMTV